MRGGLKMPNHHFSLIRSLIIKIVLFNDVAHCQYINRINTNSRQAANLRTRFEPAF